MVRSIYHNRDAQRGVHKNFIHLVEEVGELGSSIVKGDQNAVKEELADVLAWLVTVANVLNVDLEDATLARYSNSCPKCKSNPCTCNT